jgi:hypothetical protein
MLLVLKFFSLVAFGLSLINLIRFKGDWLEKLGLSFLLGTGVMSVIYFLFVWAVGRVVSFDFWLVTILLTILLFILRGTKLVFKKLELPKIQIKANLISIVCWAAVATLFLASLVYTSYTPVHTVDSIYFFDFRAKVMFLSQQLTEIQRVGNWYSYPMFTSIIGVIWRFLGIDNPSSYYPFMYFSFALVFYSILRKRVNRDLASVGTFLMYTTPITFWQSQLDGLTNISYTVFLCLSVLYIYKVMISKKPYLYDVIISSIFLGLSSWTRGSEPIWVVPLLVAAFVFLVRKKLKWIFVYYFLFYSIREIWPLYANQQYTTIVKATKIVVDNALQNPLSSPGFYEALSYTFRSMVSLIPASLGVVVYLFLTFIFIDVLFFRVSRSLKFYLFVIGGVLGVLFFGSLFMVINFNIKIHVYNDSLSRLLSILAPLMWFYIIVSPPWRLFADFVKLRKK